ncbi:MAG: hypothetical protein J6S67_21115 [Methanobrevibacter sp.]|nr:hypothetical protein [Methanobrevibacter sp.]
MADSFGAQLKGFINTLEKNAKKAESDSRKFVTLSCAEIERTAKTIMKDTLTNPDVSYGKKDHHPSYPGEAPAPDSGTLMRSITHSVVEENGEIVGYVGSIIENENYPKYLEYGTSKMKPRPWLSASLIKCQAFMTAKWKEIFGK